MQIVKVSALLLISLLMFGCDNHKSVSDSQTSSKSVQSENSSALNKTQDDYISETKRYLPSKVAPNTDLVDIYKENNSVNYKYVIKENKQDLALAESEKVTAENLKKIYCSTNPELVKFREAFPNGVNHSYYIKDEKLFTVHLALSDCKTK